MRNVDFLVVKGEFEDQAEGGVNTGEPTSGAEPKKKWKNVNLKENAG